MNIARQQKQTSRDLPDLAVLAKLEAALQLFICTKEAKYADRFNELLWPAMERGFMMNMKLAVTAVPYMDNAYKEKLKPYVQKFKTANDDIFKQNPFGVTISTGGWGGNEGVISWAITNYLLHKSFPEIIGQGIYLQGYELYFGLSSILKCFFRFRSRDKVKRSGLWQQQG